MRVAIGTDHAGFELKELLVTFLKQQKFSVEDVGTCDDSPVDYPDFAEKVARKVARSEAEKGIIICGSGVGACIAANKLKGVRASVCHDTYSAHQGVEHDDMNVLVLGARIIGIELAKELVTTFLNAQFSNEERHLRRVNKVKVLEDHFGGDK